MLKAYKEYWLGYLDFKGKTSVRGYWLAVLANFILSFFINFFVASAAKGYTRGTALTSAFTMICILPGLAITVRRLRDAGLPWTNLFWAFLPLAGGIILIVLLCKPSAGGGSSEEWEKPLSQDDAQALLGPQRIPAAILFLWGVVYSLADPLFLHDSPLIMIPWWGFLIARLTLAILLFRGKRDRGLLVPIAALCLLDMVNLFAGFSLLRLLSLAADIALGIFAAAQLLPALHKNRASVQFLRPVCVGLYLALYVLTLFLNISAHAPFFAVFELLVNGIVRSIAVWQLTGALALPAGLYAVPLSGGRSSQPVPGQTAAASAQSADVKRTGPGVLLVRFSIDMLNELSGSYGFQSGRLIGRAVPAALLEGMTISDGDSAATLRGSEYVCMVSIAAGDIDTLRGTILPLIMGDAEIRKYGAPPVATVVTVSNESLVIDGRVQGGRIIGQGGWCASGFMAAWKEAAEKSTGDSAAPATTEQAGRSNVFYVFIAKGEDIAPNMVVISHDNELPAMLKQRYPAAAQYRNVIVRPGEWDYPPYGIVAPDGSNVDWNALWNAAYRYLVNRRGVSPRAAKAGLEITANNGIGTFVPTTGKVTFGVPVEE